VADNQVLRELLENELAAAEVEDGVEDVRQYLYGGFAFGNGNVELIFSSAIQLALVDVAESSGSLVAEEHGRHKLTLERLLHELLQELGDRHRRVALNREARHVHLKVVDGFVKREGCVVKYFETLVQ